MGWGKVIKRPRPRLLCIEVRWRLRARRADTPLGSSPAAAARSGLRDGSAAARGRRAAGITRRRACLAGWIAERDARGAGPEGEETGSGGWSAAARSAGTRRAGRVALTMVSRWHTGVLLCALLGGLLLTGEARPGSEPARGRGGAAAGTAAGLGPGASREARLPAPRAEPPPGPGTLVAAGAPGSRGRGSPSERPLSGLRRDCPFAAGVAAPFCLLTGRCPRPGFRLGQRRAPGSA